MKKLLQNKALIIIFVLAVVGLVGALLMRIAGNAELEPQGEKITINQNGSQVTVYENGAVIRRSPDGTETREVWSLEKTQAFFDYYQSVYLDAEIEDQVPMAAGGGASSFIEVGGDKYPILDDDELSDIITDPNGDSGAGDSGGGDVGGGDNLDDYFDDGDGGGSDGSGGGSTGGGGDQSEEEEEECLFWRLSYCVTFPTPTPAPSPTATPGPDFEALPPTCEEILNRETGRTVISNELCVTEPTSIPNN